ncbi:lasso peptide biosynthesis B2 protein [Oceanicella actignis]|uniref:lasso peptide biosynthesis B2 protein n=1 Tax=Oceanicella actignis TaxID=1189325 RepID=UPI0011E8037B|nr:lasso peptide biosynthesis B2 protein [Oceanicella actignis]TYO89643.1 transglutaminase superfamily protein [Oceanicella actignis]
MRRARRFPPTARELRLFCAAWARLAQARMMHARMDAPAVLRRLRQPARAPGRPRAGAPTADEMRWALAAAARRAPWRADCLVQALAGKLWLESLGRDAELRLGALRGADGALTAHAWLELDGLPATGGALSPELAAFAPAADPPAAPD